MTRTTPALLAAFALIAALATAPPALAAPGQESIFMDDSRLVYGKESEVNATLDRIKALGADRLRVSVFWELVAPKPDSKERPPSFDAADPAAYPPGNWDRYDRLVSQATARGLGLLLNVTGPAPRWATGKPTRKDIEKTFRPNPEEFGRFVQAVSKRYDGTYVDDRPAPDQPLSPLPIFGPPPPEPGVAVLPRVSTWSLWNEPNHAGWLTPQWVRDPRSKRGRWLAHSPHLYRRLWDKGWQGLAATGHGSDTILLAESAPKGLGVQGTTRSIRPLRFLRELFCLSPRYQPFRGAAAKVRGCPTSRPTQAFPRLHPSLFVATGYAHHPYGLDGPPDRVDRYRDNVAMADLPRLSATLDRIFARYSNRRRLPLHLTEYGYQTDPPDPTLGIGLGAHSRWLDQAELIAYANPRVRAHTQFLLYDDAPLRAFRRSDPRYWGSWQSGLLFHDGRLKPAYASYQLPVWVVSRSKRRGRPFRIWGLIRPAANGQPQPYRVQYRRLRSRRGFTTIKSAMTGNPRGYFRTSFRIPRSGFVRVVWRQPEGDRIAVSRRVRLRVR